jgi:hypothetical protein
MEGDYYDYEKNLSRSFDSEQNARHFESRKRQRREAPILTDLNTSPLSADTQAHSASVKGTHSFLIGRNNIERFSVKHTNASRRIDFVFLF